MNGNSEATISIIAPDKLLELSIIKYVRKRNKRKKVYLSQPFSMSFKKKKKNRDDPRPGINFTVHYKAAELSSICKWHKTVYLIIFILYLEYLLSTASGGHIIQSRTWLEFS